MDISDFMKSPLPEILANQPNQHMVAFTEYLRVSIGQANGKQHLAIILTAHHGEEIGFELSTKELCESVIRSLISGMTSMWPEN